MTEIDLMDILVIHDLWKDNTFWRNADYILTDIEIYSDYLTSTWTSKHTKSFHPKFRTKFKKAINNHEKLRLILNIEEFNNISKQV